MPSPRPSPTPDNVHRTVVASVNYFGLQWPDATKRPDSLTGVVDHDQSAATYIGKFATPTGQRGIRFQIVGLGDYLLPPGGRPVTLEYEITSEDEFRPSVILANRSDAEKILLLTAIVDYRQIEFTLAGDASVLHQIKVPPATELELPLNLGKLAPGMHDILLWVFDDPYAGYEATTPDEVRVARILGALTVQSRVLATRTVVIVDGFYEPALRYRFAEETSGPGKFVQAIGFPAPLTRDSPVHPYKDQAFSIPVQPGTEVPFRLFTSRDPQIGDAVHAMIHLLDYQQIDAGSGLADFFFVAGGEEIIATRKLQIPSTRGTSHLLALLIINPYRDLLNAHGIFDDYDTNGSRIVFIAE